MHKLGRDKSIGSSNEHESLLKGSSTAHNNQQLVRCRVAREDSSE